MVTVSKLYHKLSQELKSQSAKLIKTLKLVMFDLTIIDVKLVFGQYLLVFVLICLILYVQSSIFQS